MKDGIYAEQNFCFVIQVRSIKGATWDDFFEYTYSDDRAAIVKQQERAMERFPEVRLITRFTATQLLSVLK